MKHQEIIDRDRLALEAVRKYLVTSTEYKNLTKGQKESTKQYFKDAYATR